LRGSGTGGMPGIVVTAGVAGVWASASPAQSSEGAIAQSRRGEASKREGLMRRERQSVNEIVFEKREP